MQLFPLSDELCFSIYTPHTAFRLLLYIWERAFVRSHMLVSLVNVVIARAQRPPPYWQAGHCTALIGRPTLTRQDTVLLSLWITSLPATMSTSDTGPVNKHQGGQGKRLSVTHRKSHLSYWQFLHHASPPLAITWEKVSSQYIPSWEAYADRLPSRPPYYQFSNFILFKSLTSWPIWYWCWVSINLYLRPSLLLNKIDNQT